MTSDQVALSALSTAYAVAVDSRDGDGLAALFLPDGELVVGSADGGSGIAAVCTGHDELRRVPDRLQRYERTSHVVGLRSYRVDGDRASGVVCCVAHHVLAATTGTPHGLDVIWTVRYLDDYRRTPDGWRIVRRRLVVERVGEVAVAPGAGSTS